MRGEYRMRVFANQPAVRRKKADLTLLVLVVLLLIVGLVLLYSTSTYNGRVKFHDETYYFKKQLRELNAPGPF